MTGPMNPYDAPDVQPGGMSSTTKVLLAFGIGCGVLMLLCCGVLGVGGFALYRFARSTVSEDPARIREITAEIVTIEIPAKLTPKLAVDVPMPFTGVRMMRGVVYTGAADKSVLMLGDVNDQFEGDVQTQLEEAMEGRDRRDRDGFDVLESEPFDTTIHGEPARFTVARVKRRRSKEEAWRVEGSFRGGGGPAIILLDAASKDFSKDEVMQMLQSMK
jgi:hypothetical protein